MTRKQRRGVFILGSLALLGGATALVLVALNDTIVFFQTPAQIAERGVAPNQRIRLGGLVEAGSVTHPGDGSVRFAVSDGKATLPVVYRGILPDLFREGQGVVTDGTLDVAGVFRADTVLAKHDEKYMPREVADGLKAQGVWRDGTSAK